MAMQSEVFNTFWHGRELAPLHWACLKSFPDRGHRLRVFSYRPLELPPGVEQEDARQVMPESELFEFRDSFSAFSNIFRYQLLLEQGGWWTDADVFCQTGEIPDCAYAWAPEDGEHINGAILKFPAGDPTLAAILDAARQIGPSVKVWGEIGPHLLTRHLAGRPCDGHWGSTKAFYPVHWLETYMFWLPGGGDAIREWCAGSPFVHLWAGMFRQLGIDIAKPAPRTSYLDWLAAQCGHPLAGVEVDPTTHALAIATIRRFFAQPWVREKWQRLYGDRPIPA